MYTFLNGNVNIFARISMASYKIISILRLSPKVKSHSDSIPSPPINTNTVLKQASSTSVSLVSSHEVTSVMAFDKQEPRCS